MIHRYIIEATDEVKGFDEAIEKLDREWGIEELKPCEDAISRLEVRDLLATWLTDNLTEETWEALETIDGKVEDMQSVIPKTKPCEDCISREEAIRVAEQGQIQGYEWQFKKLCNLPPVTPKPSEDCISREAVCKAINELPSVKPKGESESDD